MLFNSYLFIQNFLRVFMEIRNIASINEDHPILSWRSLEYNIGTIFVVYLYYILTIVNKCLQLRLASGVTWYYICTILVILQTDDCE